MFYDRYMALCHERKVSPSKAAEEIGINKASVTNWKKNGYTPRADILSRIADYFRVSVSSLLEDDGKNVAPAPFTRRDERDIEKRLAAMIGDLGAPSDGLMFDGEPLDEETKELLRISLQNQLEMTKRLAKQKYTPKKYRKEGE